MLFDGGPGLRIKMIRFGELRVHSPIVQDPVGVLIQPLSRERAPSSPSHLNPRLSLLTAPAAWPNAEAVVRAAVVVELVPSVPGSRRCTSCRDQPLGDPVPLA